jgi:hypothetical protein
MQARGNKVMRVERWSQTAALVFRQIHDMRGDIDTALAVVGLLDRNVTRIMARRQWQRNRLRPGFLAVSKRH